ncbi:MAG: HEAT repeat domain-containing protein [Candidatus Firestonebacteria bacterium]
MVVIIKLWEEYFTRKICLFTLLFMSVCLLSSFSGADENKNDNKKEEEIEIILKQLDINNTEGKSKALAKASGYIDEERIQKKLINLYKEENKYYLEISKHASKEVSEEQEKKDKAYYLYYGNLESLIFKKVKLDDKSRINLLVNSPNWDENTVNQIKRAGVKALDDLIERLNYSKGNTGSIIMRLIGDIMRNNEINVEQRKKIKARLIELLKDKDPYIKAGAIRCLGNFAEDKSIIEIIKFFLNDSYKGRELVGSMEEKQYWKENYPVREAAQESMKKLQRK